MTTVTLTDARAEAQATIDSIDARLPELERRRRQLALDVKLQAAEPEDLDATAAEIQTLTVDRDNALALLVEIEDRERLAVINRRAEIIAELDVMLIDLEGKRNDALAEIRRAPREAPTLVVDGAATLERQSYALAADLHRLVGGLTYRGRMALPLNAVLGAEVARLRPATSPVPHPGRALLDELAAIDTQIGTPA